jgi:hypothetical protein
MSRPPILDLSGRLVIVTGGNAGIGLGIARGVARAGADVMIWARRRDRNESAVKELQDMGTEVASVECDASVEASVDAAMAATLDRFGRLDALVANAGISGREPFTHMTLEEWRRVLTVNLDGTFLCLRAAAAQLVAQGTGGALVAVSSTSSLHGAPGQQHYAAGKAGLLGMIRSLAVELARHGIRCNSLVPGWTETELTESSRENEKFLDATTRRTPVRRWATVHDFEEVGAYLCDPRITFHTGDSLVVDGGYTIF